MPLTRCPRCSSRLIGPTATAAFPADAGRVVLDRSCPNCGHRDRVITTALAASAWDRLQAHHATLIDALADALAAGLPIEVSELNTS